MRTLPRLLLPMLVALLALVYATKVHAAGSTAQAAQRTAQSLIERTHTFHSGTAGEPQLVYELGANKPDYYLVPVERAGRTIGLVGVSADGQSWQWYNDHFTGSQFSARSETRAKQALSVDGEHTSTRLVIGLDSKLYWQAGGGSLVSADAPSTRRSVASVQSAEALTGARGSARAASEAQAVMAGSSANGAGAGSLPTARNLSVPQHYQSNNYYCGPAALEMLFDKYKPLIDQASIATAMNTKNWGTWWGAYADDLARTARYSHFPGKPLGYAAMTNFWSSGGSSDPDYANRYQDLKAIINAGYPLLMLNWYDSRHTVGHFRVLKGYDDTTGEFIVNDPWYSAPYYGPDVHFKQSFLVDNLWTDFDRWAVLVSPWKVSISAPGAVAAGQPFTVTATISYPGPHPMEGRASVSQSQATIAVPSGFLVTSPTRSLSQITASGTSQTVSWMVTPPATYSGAAGIGVTAKGQYTGSSTSYPSYTDWVGGSGSQTITVNGSSSTANSAPRTGGISPTAISSQAGEWRQVRAIYSDANGVNDLNKVRLLVSAGGSTTHALYVSYNASANTLYLRNAGDTDWIGGVAPGSQTVLDNGFGRLNAAKTTVASSGNTLTVSWALSVSTGGMTYNVYTMAIDDEGATTPLARYGSWQVAPSSTDTTAPIVSAAPPGGIYASTQRVTLSVSEPATIYYSLDGSTPTTSSPKYSGPITISTSQTLSYFAIDRAGNRSNVSTQSYTIDTTSPSVSANPPGGTYSSAQSMVLGASEAAAIYYTLDGSTPTMGSMKYTAPITVSSTRTIKYFAVDTAGNSSPIYSQTYTIQANFAARVNFQPADSDVPAGYQADYGDTYTTHGAYTYGWNTDVSFTARDRDEYWAPDGRYNTLIQMQNPDAPDAYWEIAVPNGTYTVHVVAGDADYTNSFYDIEVEGETAVYGEPGSRHHWIEGTVTVTVQDGRLTVTNGWDAWNNKIDFIEITRIS